MLKPNASVSPLSLPPRLHLAHLPTPIWRHPQLDELVGAEVWVKRDDMTGGAEAGNKIRKLEFLLADAKAQGADVVLTCGAAQSNHARATALLSRQLGFDCQLFLRTTTESDQQPVGNLLLDRLAGATVEFVSKEQYVEREALMAAAAESLRAAGKNPYIIVEGGSSGLGSLGYVQAMLEVAEQASLGLLPRQFDCVAFACGSGGTAAGVALGLGQTQLAKEALAVAVCDDAEYFRTVCDRLIADAKSLCPNLPSPATLTFDDEHQGPGYGVMSPEQKDFLGQVVKECGLVLDPVYSGKALYALAKRSQRNQQGSGKPSRVLFIHTGGLPGLLCKGEVFQG